MAIKDLTAEEYQKAMDEFFQEPDVTGCFTINDIASSYYDGSRNKAVGHIRRGVKDGKIEFVGQIGSHKYYRLIRG